MPTQVKIIQDDQYGFYKKDETGYNRDIEADWIRENPFNILEESTSNTQ